MKNLLINNYIRNQANIKMYILIPDIYYSDALMEVSVTGNRACILTRSLNEKL